MPDWAPAFINAGRAFVAIGAVELFWVVTAWPSGASAIVFVAIFVVLLSPKGDQAYIGALAKGRTVSQGKRNCSPPRNRLRRVAH